MGFHFKIRSKLNTYQLVTGNYHLSNLPTLQLSNNFIGNRLIFFIEIEKSMVYLKYIHITIISNLSLVRSFVDYAAVLNRREMV
jgi:hypothetical protein